MKFTFCSVAQARGPQHAAHIGLQGVKQQEPLPPGKMREDANGPRQRALSMLKAPDI